MKIYPREDYLKKIRPFYKSDLIKVISGIRRCGKSCLLLSSVDELRGNGVPDKDIIFLNLDKRGFKSIKTAEQLEATIDAMVKDGDYKYLFIDEVQNVKEFESVINGYREDGNFSVFITGSNSYLLSGELVTKLTGRYIEIEMFTLSFSEYLAMKRFLGKEIGRLEREFSVYLQNGGFPKALEFDDEQSRRLYLQSVINQIFKKDVAKRHKVKHRSVFERVQKYVINNFGAITSLTRLENYFRTQEKVSIRRETLRRYLDLLIDAKLLYRCSRFDMKSKKSVSGEEKYYLADTGIYFALNVDGRINYGPVLENVLFTYLRSRGYEMSVGRIGKLECDFIVRHLQSYAYIQVAMTIADKATEDREYQSLEHIGDGYPRYLFTLDVLLQQRNGIRHENLMNFLADACDLD